MKIDGPTIANGTQMTTSSKNLDRVALIKLVNQIMNSSGCMIDVDGLISTFEKNVPYPDAGQLIFDPLSGKALTAEQIVDQALDG